MEFKLLFKGTEKELSDEIEKLAAEGWNAQGDVHMLKPDYGDTSLPQFVYFAQIVTKG